MRRLHAVGKHEKFVASGLYEFEQNGAKIGLTEAWSIHEVGGAQFIRVDQDGRGYDGRSSLYEALLNPDGQIERVDVRFYGKKQEAVKEARASYTFFDDRVGIIRVVNRELRFEEEVVMPPGYAIHFASSVLSGFMIPCSFADHPDVRVFSPDMISPDAEDFLKGVEMTLAGWEFVGLDEIKIAGKTYSARVYQHDDVRIWLDPSDILLREESGSRKIILKQYARRPEPQLHD